ncbi:chloride channel protein CLC-f-like, partial [Trifolium pratense]
VHVIHEWVWAGTPNEGAAWLRLQRLADTWHRILLIPVTGGVMVGMMCGLLEILDQIKQASYSPQRQGFDLLAGIYPTVKAIQAAVTLGTGCSLGPEGPSVDIGKSCANGFSLMMENNRERKIALVAAGAAAGISSGFNAAVAGCFFAIETVLRPLRAENSPPFTTAMIILASVISSTVSNVLQGTQSAFTVPEYELKSAAGTILYIVV